MARHTGFDVVPPEQKTAQKIFPYVTFPLTTKCLFECAYCGVGGETTASYKTMPTVEFIIERTQQSYNYGIRKFRLTGGEPTLHRQFGDILCFFSEFSDIFLLVNTNAALIKKEEKRLLSNANENVHFAASLDSLTPENFDMLSGTTGYFDQVIDGIRILSERGRLLRLNMVVTRWNIHEVFQIIQFCKELKCDLKLLDVVSVPIPYNDRNGIQIWTNPLENSLARIANLQESHQYARNFGTPCNIYVIDGVRVTMKSTTHGSHYDKDGICKDCSYFPCHEGLYDLFLLADDRLCGCRWSENSVSPGKNFIECLDNLVKIFQRAEWYQPEQIVSMKPYPDFVKHVLSSDEKTSKI
jgi:cyclic pyranopterin phosphate synthase